MYNNKNVKELKAIARSRKIKGYYKMRKAELISVLSPKVKLVIKRKPHIEKPKVKLLIKPLPLLDEPVPHIERPILQPTRELRDVSSPKELASSVARPVKKKINEFLDWITSPNVRKEALKEKKSLSALKEKINRIFDKEKKELTPKLQQTALYGYLKNYRISGKEKNLS